MTPADELRAAATRLEELTGKATPGPWTCPRQIIVRAPQPPDEEGWSHTDSDGLVAVVQAQHYEGTRDMVRKRSAADLAWIVTLGPQVAAPLAAWLRAEADVAETVDVLRGAVPKLAEAVEEMVTGQASKGFRLRLTASSLDEALEFARAVNGGAPDA